METKKITISEAVERLREALKEDPDYFYSWQANIAVQFQDEMRRAEVLNKIQPISQSMLHAVSNMAAENFLNLLIKD